MLKMVAKLNGRDLVLLGLSRLAAGGFIKVRGQEIGIKQQRFSTDVSRRAQAAAPESRKRSTVADRGQPRGFMRLWLQRMAAPL